MRQKPIGSTLDNFAIALEDVWVKCPHGDPCGVRPDQLEIIPLFMDLNEMGSGSCRHQISYSRHLPIFIIVYVVCLTAKAARSVFCWASASSIT